MDLDPGNEVRKWVLRGGPCDCWAGSLKVAIDGRWTLNDSLPTRTSDGLTNNRICIPPSATSTAQAISPQPSTNGASEGLSPLLNYKLHGVISHGTKGAIIRGEKITTGEEVIIKLVAYDTQYRAEKDALGALSNLIYGQLG